MSHPIKLIPIEALLHGINVHNEDMPIFSGITTVKIPYSMVDKLTIYQLIYISKIKITPLVGMDGLYQIITLICHFNPIMVSQEDLVCHCGIKTFMIH